MGRTLLFATRFGLAAFAIGVVSLATPSIAGPCSSSAGLYNRRYTTMSPGCVRRYESSKFTIHPDCTWDSIQDLEPYCKGSYDPTRGKWITTDCYYYDSPLARYLDWKTKDPNVYVGSGYADPKSFTWNIRWTSPDIGGRCTATQITSRGKVPLPATISQGATQATPRSKVPSPATISQGPKHPREYPSSNAKRQYDQCLKAATVSEFSLKVAAQVGFAKALTKVLPVGSALYNILTKSPLIPTTKTGLIMWLQSEGIKLGPNAVAADAVEDIFLLALRQQWREYCVCVWLDNKPWNAGCSSKGYSPVVFDGYMVYACNTLGTKTCSDAGRKAAADAFCRKKGASGLAAKYNVKFINVPYSIMPATGAFCDKDVTCSHEVFGWILCT